MYANNFGFPNPAVATGPYGAPPGSQNPHQQHQQHQPHQQHQQQHHPQQHQHPQHQPQSQPPPQPQPQQHQIQQPGQGHPNPPPQHQPQHHPQHHQLPHQHPHQQQQHPQQHMMYNPQQFPMGGQPSPGGFPGAPNMMPGAGPAGMMQNTGMQHMAAANGQMHNYQPPYTNTPYGAAVAAQMGIPSGYPMAGGMPMPGFPMHPGMTPQQQQMMQQRMQPAQPSPAGVSTPTPPRTFQSQPQGTPTPINVPTSQPPQVPTPNNRQPTPQAGTPNNAQQQQQHPPPPSQQQPPPQQQPQQQQQQQQHQQQQQQQHQHQHQQQPQHPQHHPPNNIQTPQTPTFPSSAQGNAANSTSSGSTPLSPGADSKDKERFALILEINNELLLEAMQIQHTQQVLKKERISANGNDNMSANPAESKPTEGEELLSSDYIQCMRRLQSNLSYLAALTNRKDHTAPAPCPAYLKAPPLNTSIQVRQQGPEGAADSKIDPSDREATAKYLQELYRKLQALFPGIDPNKEPAIPVPGMRPGGQPINAPNRPGAHTSAQASPVSGNNRTPKMATSGPPQQPAASVGGV